MPRMLPPVAARHSNASYGTSSFSDLPLNRETRHGPQAIGGLCQRFERGHRRVKFHMRPLPAGLEAEQAGVRVLPLARVFVGGLAKLLRRTRYIEHIIDDLKRQTQVSSKLRDGKQE